MAWAHGLGLGRLASRLYGFPKETETAVLESDAAVRAGVWRALERAIAVRRVASAEPASVRRERWCSTGIEGHGASHFSGEPWGVGSRARVTLCVRVTVRLRARAATRNPKRQRRRPKRADVTHRSRTHRAEQAEIGGRWWVRSLSA